ncbi:MAG: sigma-54 dependent transcriptional regulator [bacterium]|nr:sigma-54 dependent transcriptional regulator [bacterium]
MNKIQELINDNAFLKILLESIPCSVLVIDKNLLIQTVNDFLGKQFEIETNSILQQDSDMSDVLNCYSAAGEHKACGLKGACSNCQILGLMKDALNGDSIHRKKIKIKTWSDAKWQDIVVLVSAAPLVYHNERFAIILIEDITELTNLRRQTKMQSMFAGLVGQNKKMLDLFEAIEDLALVNVPVLIQGESGTGKELVASAIHREGKRSKKPFIAVNCGALPETLLESELFGYVKGAFTGAARDKKGRFELADGGTIFLDEIGDISQTMQVKLLRVLQEGTFERVGSEVTTKVDVRVISASNKDIQKEVAAGRFREDLYYRLFVVPLYIPPLRERPDDIPLLVDHFLKEAVIELEKDMTVLSPEAAKLFLEYKWPGNIRELQNAIKYALVKCKEQIIEPVHLPPFLQLKNGIKAVPMLKKSRRKKLNTKSVRDALEQTNENKVEAARVLGVSRATLYRFLDEMP